MIKETRYEHYFVTEKGEVFSNKRGELKPMAICTRKDGYQQVRVNGTSLVHRLVADTFISNVDGLTVNHKNGIRDSNGKSNLEVVTQKRNIQHAIEIGLRKHGENHSRAIYSDEFISTVLNDIGGGLSVRAASKKHGISRSYLNRIKNGENRKNLSN